MRTNLLKGHTEKVLEAILAHVEFCDGALPAAVDVARMVFARLLNANLFDLTFHHPSPERLLAEPA
jgi:hypothetical protein